MAPAGRPHHDSFTGSGALLAHPLAAGLTALAAQNA
jgi:hypothetical protein